MPWLQDNAYYGYAPADAQAVWSVLDDCDEANGCMRVAPGSHHRGLRPHGPTGAYGISCGLTERIDPEAEVNLVLKRGDASLHHCVAFPASQANRSDRSRRSLVLFYHAARCTVDFSVLEDCRKARDEMLSQGG